ncbi:MAG: thymidylate synthase [Brevibacterium sp.]|nr:thymidylate synthase [Brevibacterium sp.]MDN5876485.1 thymidylate synthase [Brevibacterium sp.]MDN6124152.1 thymidylate synthase [Brevibacterium sp.]MDN6174859.1 thymidylate synthase [Brevibacterium sp.]MDN6189451.1 thymidylate synthase [Brevibacterium sp.]
MKPEYPDLHTLYLDSLRQVYTGFEYQNSPRGQDEREIIGFTARLANPTRRYCLARSRRQNIIFNYAEALWYLSGKNDLDFIRTYAPSMSQYSPDGLSLPGTGYGPKLLRHVGGETAIGRIVNILNDDDPASKRAVLQIFDDSEDIYRRNIDVSCTLALQLLRRDDRLHMVAFMRANDAYMGLLNDTFSFTFVQEFLASMLGLTPGVYIHNVGSIHIYEKDLTKVDSLLDGDDQTIVEEPTTLPQLPSGVSLDQVHQVLDLEQSIRADRLPGRALATVDLPEAWVDIVRLFWIHRQLQCQRPVDPSIIVDLHPLHRGLVVNRWPSIENASVGAVRQ